MKGSDKELDSLLTEVLQLSEQRGVQMMPFFGTLLGIFRNGGVIPGDDDVDFIARSSDREVMKGLFLELGLTEVNDGLANWFMSGYRVRNGQKATLDIYFFFEEDGRLSLPWNFVPESDDGSTDLHIPKDLSKVLIDCLDRGSSLVRADMSKVLQFLYGEDFEIPKVKGLHYTTVIQNHRPVHLKPHGIKKLLLRLFRAYSWCYQISIGRFRLLISSSRGSQ